MTAARTSAYGAVLLTQGRRPAELTEALDSLRRQCGVEVQIVVVGNGWAPAGLPDGVRALALPDNVGIPAGRNAGVSEVAGDLLVFLDDDASLPDDDALARIARRFVADSSLGLVQPRVIDPSGHTPPSRWVPRLRVGDPARSSDVCAVWEGAVVIRRRLFDEIGGWPAPFFYAHEGIELAWRVWDAGYRVRYLGDVVVHHAAVRAWRHADGQRQQARNRVWLARRNLPLPLGMAYVTSWLLLDLARSRGAASTLLRGYLDGLSQPAGKRRPISWRTAWRMTRAGRPPIV